MNKKLFLHVSTAITQFNLTGYKPQECYNVIIGHRRHFKKKINKQKIIFIRLYSNYTVQPHRL